MPFVYNVSSEYGNIFISLDKNLKFRPIAHRIDPTTVQVSKPGDIVIRFSEDAAHYFDRYLPSCIRKVQLDSTGRVTHNTDSVSEEFVDELFARHPWLEEFVEQTLKSSYRNCEGLPLSLFPKQHDIQYTKQKKILIAFLKRHGITDIDPDWFMSRYPDFEQNYQKVREWAEVFKFTAPHNLRECMGHSDTGTKHVAWYGIKDGAYPKAVNLNFKPIVRDWSGDGNEKKFTPGDTGLPNCQAYSHFIRIQWLELPQSDGKIIGESINFVKNIIRE